MVATCLKLIPPIVHLNRMIPWRSRLIRMDSLFFAPTFSLLMPQAKHFTKRQYLQRLLLILSMVQLPPFLHINIRLARMALLKNELQGLQVKVP